MHAVAHSFSNYKIGISPCFGYFFTLLKGNNVVLYIMGNKPFYLDFRSEQAARKLPGLNPEMFKEMLFQCCQLQLNAAGSLVAFQAQSECKACHSDTLSPHVEKCEV